MICACDDLYFHWCINPFHGVYSACVFCILFMFVLGMTDLSNPKFVLTRPIELKTLTLSFLDAKEKLRADVSALYNGEIQKFVDNPLCLTLISQFYRKDLLEPVKIAVDDCVMAALRDSALYVFMHHETCIWERKIDGRDKIYLFILHCCKHFL